MGYVIIFLYLLIFLSFPIDKLQRQMGSDDNVLRTKILIEINEDFHDGAKLN